MSENYDTLLQSISSTWIETMKRDIDLIRTILLKIEESDDPTKIDVRLFSTNHSIEQIQYHLKLLCEAGFIEVKGFREIILTVSGLTWSGHDFLDAARDKSRWEKAKEIIFSKLGSNVFIFDLLKQVLFDLAKQQLGLQ
jgi:hypothetical protein